MSWQPTHRRCCRRDERKGRDDTALSELAALTHEEAIERARHEADARLWPWIGPIKVRRRRRFLFGPRRWRVKSNRGSIGMHVVVIMDDTGRVLSANVWRD